MHSVLIQFAAENAHETAEQASGIAALGLNLQSFLFQLITFVIVLVILRQFVFKKLVKVLEDRRNAVEKSLEHAAETEAELKKTEAKINKMIEDARAEADGIVANGHKESSAMIEAAEIKAQKKAEHIVSEAKGQVDVELAKARTALKEETARLVIVATEQIIKEKIDAKKDSTLINSALKRAEEKA